VPSAFTRLTSRQHAVVRECRDLARGRGAAETILLDGAHVVAEALANHVTIQTALVSAAVLRDAGPHGRALVDRLARSGTRVFEANDAALDAASPVRTTSGLVAVAHWRPAPLDAVLTPAPAMAVGLVGVQDPGNLGAAIRSADALGATGVVALDAGADPAGWKALRGAMGSTFRLPVARGTLDAAVAAAHRDGIAIVAAAARGGSAPDALALRKPTLLLFGSEGAGLDAAALPPDATRVTIPMRPGAESLNVSVAVALVLDEARRQRRSRKSA